MQTGYACNQRNDADERTLHGGPTATVEESRRQIRVTQAMKKASVCNKMWFTCLRFNSGPTQQLMGELPSSRNEAPESAFCCVCLDFAGPLTFKNGTECVKGYLVVFLFCFEGSSSRGSIIFDVRCDDSSFETIHCKTGHRQSNCVRQCNQQSWVHGVTSMIWRKRSGQGTVIQHY